MKNTYQILTEKLLENKIFAVIRLNNKLNAIRIIEAVINGGIENIEITLTTPDAFNILYEAKKQFSNRAIIGVGSVLNSEMAIKSINSGAEFVVTPILDTRIIDICHANEHPVLSGAFSPTEIYRATESGADVVKVFPANNVGMSYFKAIKAPMPSLKIMPTGGVTLDNVGDWFAVGACAVGIGSALLEKRAIEEKKFDKITQNAKLVLDNIHKYFENEKIL